MGKVANGLLDLVGDTPMVRLNKVTTGVRPRIFAKLEFLNPGGSIKDRIGLAMVLDAEKSGLLRPGYTIVEPTSGNTGMGLALAAVSRGYKLIFTLPDKMSREKIDLLKAVGAKVVVTPTRLPPGHPDSYIEVAKRIARETPNSYMPNQYRNASNPGAHFETTGPEIWSQTRGKVDVLVAGVGTGGTISGTGRYLKGKRPSILVVGVEPQGSILGARFRRTEVRAHQYEVEGIGEDFIPETLDMGVIDEFVTVTDKEALLMTRRLAREEGMLVGSSSGAAVFGALKVARRLDSSKTLVVILPDTGRSYLNKVYNDSWMADRGFIPGGGLLPVRSVLRSKPKGRTTVVTVRPDDDVGKAVRLMSSAGVSHLPVVKGGLMLGSLNAAQLLGGLSESPSLRVAELMGPPYPTIGGGASVRFPAGRVAASGALVVVEHSKVTGIITVTDVVRYLGGR